MRTSEGRDTTLLVFAIYRYDYTGCDAATASKVLAALEHWIADHANQNKTLTSSGKTYTVATADNFSYTDPIDNSVSSKQVGANAI